MEVAVWVATSASMNSRYSMMTTTYESPLSNSAPPAIQMDSGVFSDKSSSPGE